MSYMLNIFNCIASIAAVVITTMTYNKIVKLNRRKSIKEVLFSCSASGCCNDTDFSTVNKCSNRYCFKNNLGQIIRLIDQSQHSICLALYTLNLSDVQRALKNANRRGVQIRIITTEGSMSNLSKDFSRLSTSGINIRFPTDGADRLLHHKFCIVDGQKRDPTPEEVPSNAVLLTGSMNWTMTSFTSNWDNIVVTSNEEFIEKYQNEFDSVWRSLRRSPA